MDFCCPLLNEKNNINAINLLMSLHVSPPNKALGKDLTLTYRAAYLCTNFASWLKVSVSLKHIVAVLIYDNVFLCFLTFAKLLASNNKVVLENQAVKATWLSSGIVVFNIIVAYLVNSRHQANKNDFKVYRVPLSVDEDFWRWRKL